MVLSTVIFCVRDQARQVSGRWHVPGSDCARCIELPDPEQEACARRWRCICEAFAAGSRRTKIRSCTWLSYRLFRDPGAPSRAGYLCRKGNARASLHVVLGTLVAWVCTSHMMRNEMGRADETAL